VKPEDRKICRRPPSSNAKGRGAMWGLQSHRVVVEGSHAGRHGSFCVPGRLRIAQVTDRVILSGTEEICRRAGKGLLISLRSGYNYFHEKSRPARHASFRQPSIRRHRIIVRRARPVGFGAGGAKEDVAAITRDPHYRNSQAGPITALFFLAVARDGRAPREGG
jgi:hypothetical protein